MLSSNPFPNRYRSRWLPILIGASVIGWLATVFPVEAQTVAAETMEANAQTLLQRQGPALFLAMAGFLLIFRRRSRNIRHSAAVYPSGPSALGANEERDGQAPPPPSSR